MAHLIMAVAGGKRKIPIRSAVVTFGRDPANEIVIYDPAAAGMHCRITRTPKGYLLEDLGSVHGTWVNGKRVASKLLEETDVIRIGEARMALRGISVKATRGAAEQAPPCPAPGASPASDPARRSASGGARP